MTLGYLLLCLLAEPASGYDLKRAFALSMRHFWDADLSQIYPTLRRLEREGWLARRREPSSRGPARWVYRRTAAGTRALRAWLAAAPEMPQPRLPWLGQLAFQHEIGDLRRSRAFLAEIRAAFVARREALRKGEAEWFRSDPGWPDRLPDDLFFGHLTLQAGLMRHEATIAWCDAALRRLDARLRRSARSARLTARGAPRGPR